jgi:hypothetical protein
VTECLDGSYFRCVDNLSKSQCETTNPYSVLGFFDGYGVFKPATSCSSSPCDNPLP